MNLVSFKIVVLSIQIKTNHNFERNEIRTTGFLKWTDFNSIKIVPFSYLKFKSWTNTNLYLQQITVNLIWLCSVDLKKIPFSSIYELFCFYLGIILIFGNDKNFRFLIIFMECMTPKIETFVPSSLKRLISCSGTVHNLRHYYFHAFWHPFPHGSNRYQSNNPP